MTEHIPNRRVCVLVISVKVKVACRVVQFPSPIVASLLKGKLAAPTNIFAKNLLRIRRNVSGM